MWLSDNWEEYEVLECTAGKKLERAFSVSEGGVPVLFRVLRPEKPLRGEWRRYRHGAHSGRALLFYKGGGVNRSFGKGLRVIPHFATEYCLPSVIVK